MTVGSWGSLDVERNRIEVKVVKNHFLNGERHDLTKRM